MYIPKLKYSVLNLVRKSHMKFILKFADGAAIGCVLCCKWHGRASISSFIYRALSRDRDVSTGIVMGTVPMTIRVDTSRSTIDSRV